MEFEMEVMLDKCTNKYPKAANFTIMHIKKY